MLGFSSTGYPHNQKQLEADSNTSMASPWAGRQEYKKTSPNLSIVLKHAGEEPLGLNKNDLVKKKPYRAATFYLITILLNFMQNFV